MIFQGKGGSNTKTGLAFEGQTDLSEFLASQKGYTIFDDKVFFDREIVGRIFKKHSFYNFLADLGINWKKIISKDRKSVV